MYVTNMDRFGHLKEMETYTMDYKHNDIYQIFDNRLVSLKNHFFNVKFVS